MSRKKKKLGRTPALDGAMAYIMLNIFVLHYAQLLSPFNPVTQDKCDTKLFVLGKYFV